MSFKIKINRNLVDKNRVEKRPYKNKDGVEVVEESYKFEAIELTPDKQKVISSRNDWQLVKTHFITHERTKEEREQKVRLPIVGEVLSFEKSGITREELAHAAAVSARHAVPTVEYPTEEINPDSIPF